VPSVADEPNPDPLPELPAPGEEPEATELPTTTPPLDETDATGDVLDALYSRPSPRASRLGHRAATATGRSGFAGAGGRRGSNGVGGMYGSPMGASRREDPLKDIKNPDDLVVLSVEKLNEADRHLEMQTQRAAQGYREATDQQQRGQLKAALATLIEKHFEVRHAIRRKEIAELEAQVKQLRDLLERRKQAQEKIVDMRLQQFIRTADGLGWDASLGGRGSSGFSGEYGSMRGGFGAGGVGPMMMGGGPSQPPKTQSSAPRRPSAPATPAAPLMR